MAYDGELVKMQDGRWARFQRCRVFRPGEEDAGETMCLIAVEVDEHHQRLLDAAADTLAQYTRHGVSMQVEIRGASHEAALQIDEAAPSVH